MESIIFTQLSVNEIREMLREEIQNALQGQIIENQAQLSVKESYMNIQQLAGYINLAVSTIYNLASKGEIPYIKKGKKLRFEKENIDNWLNEGRRKSNNEVRKVAEHYTLKRKTV